LTKPVKLVNKPLVRSCARMTTENGVLLNRGNGIWPQAKSSLVTTNNALELRIEPKKVGHPHGVVARLTGLDIGRGLGGVGDTSGEALVLIDHTKARWNENR